MNSDLIGRVVLVTGASGGIGSAIARAFAQEGARLIIHYRKSRREAQRVAEKLGADCVILGADLTSEAETRRFFAQALDHYGHIDTLIANAGSWETRDVPLPQMSLRQWQRTLDNVLTATFLSLREFLRIVARQKSGNAVLIASTAAIFGEAGHGDYAAAKAALAFGLTRTLKNEIARLAPHRPDYCGGRVNCICPGWTLVPRTAPQLRDRRRVRRIMATMALPQIARPEDIAHAAVFLSSDTLARHITGQILTVAGGMEGRLLWNPDEINAEISRD